MDMCIGSTTVIAASMSTLPVDRFTEKCPLLPERRIKAFTGSRTSKMVG